MSIAQVTEWWDRYGDKTKKDKINEIIDAINDYVVEMPPLIHMQMEPAAGAAWADKEKHCIELNSANERGECHGHIPSGFARFRIRVAYSHGSNGQSSSMRISIHDAASGEDCNGNDRLNTSTETFSTTTGGYLYYWTSDWYTLSSLPCMVWCRVLWSSGNGMRLLGVAIEADVESS